MRLRQIALLLAASALLCALTGQVNHYLGEVHVHLFVGGLYVTLAALRLDARAGAWVAGLAGLLVDTAAPVAFGTQAFLFLCAHAVIHALRHRFPREETLLGVVVALLANLALFVVLSFALVGDAPAVTDAWLRLFADLIASQLFVALIAPWFFAFQASLLEIGGAGLRRDPRGLM